MCKQYKESADEKVKFLKTIQSIDDNKISPLPVNMINSIIKKSMSYHKEENNDYFFEQNII